MRRLVTLGVVLALAAPVAARAQADPNSALGPRGADSLGPRGGQSLGPHGGASLGPGGGASMGPRGGGSVGPRGGESYGPGGGWADDPSRRTPSRSGNAFVPLPFSVGR